jgi:hypothetical protein
MADNFRISLSRKLIHFVTAIVAVLSFAACPAAWAAADRPQSAQLPSTSLVVASSTSFLDGYGLFTKVSGSRCQSLVGRTSDGGARFTGLVKVLSSACADGTQWTMAADDSGDVFVYGPGLYASHDRGRSWSRVRGTGQVLAVAAARQSVWMLRQSCVASGLLRCHATLMVSADGGLHWRRSAVQPDGARYHPSGHPSGPYSDQDWLVRTGASSGYVLFPPGTARATSTSGAGSLNALLRYTSNGGASWVTERVPCAQQTFDGVTMAAVPGTRDLAAICSGEPGGLPPVPTQVKLVAVSVNGGRSWRVRLPCSLDINRAEGCVLANAFTSQIAAPSASTIYKVGTEAGLVASHDGGKVWKAVSLPHGAAADTYQVQFFGKKDGRVVGISKAGVVPAIWTTTDGGARWSIKNVTPG